MKFQPFFIFYKLKTPFHTYTNNLGETFNKCCVPTNQVNREGDVRCDPVKPLAQNSEVNLWHFPTEGRERNKNSSVTMRSYDFNTFKSKDIKAKLFKYFEVRFYGGVII